MILDREAFWPRVISIFDRWTDGSKDWGYSESVTSVDALVLLCGKFDEETPFLRSVTTEYLLFGMPVNDIAMVLTKDKTFHVICSPTIAKSISTLGDSSPCGQYTLKITEKVKGDPEEDGRALLTLIKGSGNGMTAGIFLKEKPNSLYSQRLRKVLEDSPLTLVDCSQGLSSVALVKDSLAIEALRVSARITAATMSLYGIGKTLNLAEQGREVAHSDWSTKCEAVIREPTKIQISGVDSADVDVPFYPSIQSGAECELALDAHATDKPIKYDVILLSLSASYKSLCTTVARTLMLNPTAEQREAFQLMLAIRAAALAAIAPGRKIKEVRLAAEQHLRTNKPEWSDKFIKSMGAGIGFEFNEQALQLNSSNPTEFKAGMTFSVAIGLGDLPRSGGKPYSLLFADTVLVTANGHEVLTADAPISASILLQTLSKEASAAPVAIDSRKQRQLDAAEKLRLETEKEEEFRKRQQEIMRRRAEERVRALDAPTSSTSSVQQQCAESYPSIRQLPAQSRGTKLYVDPVRESVIIPINGMPVPFHVSHIRSLGKTQSEDTYTVQIRFHTPDRTGKAPLSAVNAALPENAFLNELTLRSHSEELFQVFLSLDQLRKEYLQKLKEQQMKNSIVEQEKLEIINKSPLRLLEVSCAPNISKSRKALGRLTAHANGLRFLIDDANRSHLDIINSNIKCCFFQRADSFTNRVLIHFELVNPILIDKNKKTSFVQFYREIAEESQDVGHNSFEDDEYEMQQEELERQKRKESNNRFKDFCRQLEDHWRERHVPVEFCIPSYKLKFTGTVGRSGSVDIIPTSGNCLVALDDKPPFVVQLSDIDYIAFERFTDRNRNCDVTLIHKDLKTVTNISAVGKEFVKPLQDWLIGAEIPFDQFDTNLLWKNILEDIHTEGIAQFYAEGGWINFSNDQDAVEDVENSGSESGTESEYDISGSESGSSDDFTTDDSDDGSDSDSDASGSGSGSGSGSEEDDGSDVADWDELEQKALREDKQKLMEEKRKMASSGGSQKRKRGHDSD